MCVFICIYVHDHVHVRVYVYAYVLKYVRMYMCTCTCTCKRTCTRTCTCTFIRIFFWHMYMYLHASAYKGLKTATKIMLMYICIYLIYTRHIYLRGTILEYNTREYSYSENETMTPLQKVSPCGESRSQVRAVTST